MILESEDFKNVVLTPLGLKSMLSSHNSLKIDIILIALTNCKPFCEVFKSYDVPLIVSFDYQSDQGIES